jgi:hypothetical protein
MALQAGGLCRVGSFTGVFVDGKREVAKDDTQTRTVILFNFLKRPGEPTAGWTLEVAEFFERDRSIGRSARVHGIGCLRCDRLFL